MENIISVSHLSFGYDSKRKVLENINFQLKKGESVGLVGANGVGKSTLLRILVGLNTGFQGDVMVNNIPLEKKNLKTIRKNVGYVFQDADSQLFMSTVFDLCNIFPEIVGGTFPLPCSSIGQKGNARPVTERFRYSFSQLCQTFWTSSLSSSISMSFCIFFRSPSSVREM